MWLLVAMLTGCQAPFGRDRHDLAGNRIAALTADVRGGFVEPRLALIVDGRPWASSPAAIDWYWIDAVGDAADLSVGSFGVGLGPAPRFAVQGDRIAVLVTIGDEVLRAELDVADRAASDVRLTSAVVEGVDLESVEGPDLALESRRSWSSTPARVVPPGGFARLTLEGVTGDGLARFMATGDGTFFELDRQRADWVAGELLVDDLEIEDRAVGEPGPITFVAVEIAADRSGFAATDLFVGEAPPGVWIANRFVATDEPATGRVWAVLAADDASPTGLALTDVQADAGEAWDAADLPCEGVAGDTFDPTWLLEHRCLRDALVGERVPVEVDP